MVAPTAAPGVALLRRAAPCCAVVPTAAPGCTVLHCVATIYTKTCRRALFIIDERMDEPHPLLAALLGAIGALQSAQGQRVDAMGTDMLHCSADCAGWCRRIK